MTEPAPAENASRPLQPAPPRSRRRVGLLLGAGVLVLIAAVASAWWLLRPPVALPPLPADIQDSEVRQAVEEARAEVIETPRSAAAWGHLGKIFLTHLFDREADFCFMQAAQLDPNDPCWPYARGLIALKRNPDNAPTLLRQAIDASAERPGYRGVATLELAEALLERGQADEAAELFRAERRHRPHSARAALGLGLVALARDDAATASSLLNAARADPHGRKKAISQLALLARRRGEVKTADELEREAAPLPDDPPWPDPFLDEILALQVGRRSYERRIARFEKQHRYPEAVELCLKQIKIQPSAQAHTTAGINLARLRRYEEAMPHLRKGVELDPEGAQAHYALGLALFSRAEIAWQKTPGDRTAKDWLREAVVQSRRAAELRPDLARSYLFWGLSLKYLGEFKDAVKPLLTGVACQPADFELQLALGQVLLALGEKDVAQVHLDNAARINPNDPRPTQARQPSK